MYGIHYNVISMVFSVDSQVHGGEFGIGTEALCLVVTAFVNHHVTVATHVTLLPHETNYLLLTHVAVESPMNETQEYW